MARKRRNGAPSGRAPSVVYVQAQSSAAPARPGLAARRRRRRARLRAGRSSGVAEPSSAMVPYTGGFQAGASAMSNVPVAIRYPMSNRAPVIQPSPDGIEVTHRQRVAKITGSATGAPFTVSMNPAAHGWMAGVAEHFQHYQILNAKYSFVSRVSTGSGGTVVMAPYYLANHPATMLGSDPEGMFDFLRDLPGVKEFAVWASDEVGVVTSKFTRQIFRTIGVLALEPQNFRDRAVPYAEDENPGWLCGICTDLSGTTGRESGELWCEYRVRLTAPKSRQTSWVSYISTSTNDAALALPDSNYMGEHRLMFPIGTNTFRCGVSGLYTCIIKRTGTNPVEAAASWAVKNFNGDTISTSAITNSVVSGAFEANDTLEDHALGVGSATLYLFVLHLRLNENDEVTVPALTSGSVTQSAFHWYRGAPSILYES